MAAHVNFKSIPGEPSPSPSLASSADQSVAQRVQVVYLEAAGALVKLTGLAVVTKGQEEKRLYGEKFINYTLNLSYEKGLVSKLSYLHHEEAAPNAEELRDREYIILARALGLPF